MKTIKSTDEVFANIIQDIEPLKSLEAANWGEFFGGVSIGISLVGLGVAGVAIT